MANGVSNNNFTTYSFNYSSSPQESSTSMKKEPIQLNSQAHCTLFTSQYIRRHLQLWLIHS
jgi:hypothetical protein